MKTFTGQIHKQNNVCLRESNFIPGWDSIKCWVKYIKKQGGEQQKVKNGQQVLFREYF